MSLKATVAACLILTGAASADAKEKAAQSPLVDALTRCRGQSDDAARLRCYDAAAGALTAAAVRGDVVVVDQQDLKKARRSLFGFSVPKLPFFGGDRSADEQSDELTASIKSARAIGNGKWQMRLEDGALWETTEASSVISDPKPGNAVVIKRGALGGYMIRIAGQRALRAKRVG
jgi:hypothetical protein